MSLLNPPTEWLPEAVTLIGSIGLAYLHRVHASIKAVKSQVTKNGGSSMLDAVHRVEKELRTLSTMTDAYWHIEDRALFRTDEKGNCVWINGTYAVLTGKTQDELRGHGWSQIMARQDRDRVVGEWNLAVADWRRFDATFTIVNSVALKQHKVHCRAFPLVNQGVLEGYVGGWTVLQSEDILM